MKSFSRRLGFLHASKEAKTIAQRWLGTGGLLGDVSDFNDLGRAMFKSVAPVAPGETVSALERACAHQPASAAEYCELLRALAYDAIYFERCTKLIATGLVENKDNAESHRGQVFSCLFQLRLFGTMQKSSNESPSSSRSLLLRTR